ncbi:hypothetical protein [Thermohalobacter berrensis]|uniref:Uncharacterized protein n=1 Tax=Thermohalobacter berrensis TaxID=99594 RepID=A0A419SUU1_9FIRM|nr:hypothetical protein [Thermohalobacter berrensis]RKD28989.1 hypothetical protein BET03_06490 [Thermohalobacter berrensis]
MLFSDYTQTGYIYHIVPITDLNKTLNRGIKYDDKNTYVTKYLQFHRFIDKYKPIYIPDWVIREKAIFGSMNFSSNHYFHSHSALLAVKINPKKCWIANENLANCLYEPYILKNIEEFKEAEEYIKKNGEKIIQRYWETSLSFTDNLEKRKDKNKGYDAEVLIFHDILPKDIKLLSIVSDHKIMSVEEWKRFFTTKKL